MTAAKFPPTVEERLRNVRKHLQTATGISPTDSQLISIFDDVIRERLVQFFRTTYRSTSVKLIAEMREALQNPKEVVPAMPPPTPPPLPGPLKTRMELLFPDE